MALGPFIDFWFSVGSTYTYLSVARLEDVASREKVFFRWRPFDVQKIMKDQKNYPFSNKPVKAAYMWRDIERRARWYGIPATVPAPYPSPELELANRVAILGSREGWCTAYVKATYRRWFVDGRHVGCEPNLSDSLLEIGQDPVRVLSLAHSEEIASLLRTATDEARSLQIFGTPSFVVEGEVFWGDDRLEDAIKWRTESDQARTHPR